MSIQLTIMSIDFDSFEEPFTKVYHKNEITVGRTAENDLVLDRPEVSSVHAKLIARLNGDGDEPKLYVVDLGSSNGTMLERDSLIPEREIPIHPNQRIIIGSYLLKPSVVGGLVTEEEHVEEAVEAAREPEHVPTLEAVEEIVEEAAAPVVEAQEDDSSVTHEMPIPQEIVPEMLATHHAGFVPPVLTLAVDHENVLDLDFVASELFRISGQILHKGQPLAGVEVDGGVLGAARTGFDGRFSFPDIVEGTSYAITLSREGYELEPKSFRGVVESETSISSKATKLYRVKGRVLHKGAPLAGVEISGGAIGKTTTDASGRFVFDDVRDGTEYRIRAAKERFLFDAELPSGTVEKDVELELSARQLLRIGGRVVHKGRPLSGVEIECVHLGKTTTDENGHYTFENVPEGAEYTFTASKPGFRLSHTRNVH